MRIFCFLLLPFALFSQSVENPYNEQRLYDDEVRAVQLYLRGAPLTFPMVALNAPNGSLVLSFDHLGTEVRNYTYSLHLCDANWQPTELDDNQYIDGFTEDRISEFYNSFNTLKQYVHYNLHLPNANTRWTKSGNYLLKVYDITEDKYLVMVRRFVVVEQVWSLATDFTRPVNVQKMNTHHEIDFTVSVKGTRVSYPQREIQAYVLQNGRWDTGIGPLSPYVIRGDQLVYDYQDKIVFPAGKEWRFFDMRSFMYRGEFVRSIQSRSDYFEVTLQTDESRANSPYVYRGDLNGRFSIETNTPGDDIENCDYAKVLFSLKRNAAYEDEDVYVFGELSDWQIKPEFKMTYEESVNAYVCEALLKQGYYNYQYLLVDRKTGQADEEALEGNWYETANQYYIFIYYRPFGQRYDRLMAATVMDTRQR